MNQWTNYHTHSLFCDGNSDPEKLAEAAVNLNMHSLGFSSHAPLPFEQNWVLDEQRFEDYAKKIGELKIKFKDKINILLGLEIDFSEGCVTPFAEKYLNKGLDYTIGSIHFFPHKIDEPHLTIDSGEDELIAGINYFAKGDPQKAVEDYYRSIRSMLENFKIDMVGHLDLIKKNNKDSKFFKEEDKWYQDEILLTLEAVKKSGVILEVNTGGINRKKIDTLYPSEWILRLAKDMEIPITVNADAHSPGELIGSFERAAEMLNKIGYKETHILTDFTWRPYPLTPSGIKIK